MKKLTFLFLMALLPLMLNAQNAKNQSSTMSTEEMYKLGLDYYEGRNGKTQNYTEAVKWFRKAAERENTKAQNYLGVCYKKGYGVTKNDTEAVKWYRKAAEQGLAVAQNNLGSCYYNGVGVTQDYAEAVKWYRKAAAQGRASSQYNFGMCYEYGNGVTKDKEEAIKWYRKAANQGYEKAKKRLAELDKISTTASAQNSSYNSAPTQKNTNSTPTQKNTNSTPTQKNTKSTPTQKSTMTAGGTSNMKTVGKALIWKEHKGFHWEENVKWSGNLKNGKIDGKGEGNFVKGVAFMPDINFFIKGEYREGYPIGECFQSEKFGRSEDWNNIKVFPFVEGVARIRTSFRWGYIKENYELLFSNEKVYSALDGKRVDFIEVSDFHGNYAYIGYSPDFLFLKIDKSGKIIDIAEEKAPVICAILDKIIAAWSAAFTSENIISKNISPSKDAYNRAYDDAISYLIEYQRRHPEYKWEQRMPKVVNKLKLYEEIKHATTQLTFSVDLVPNTLKEQAKRIEDRWKSTPSMVGADIQLSYKQDEMKKNTDRVRKLLNNPQFKLKDPTAASTARKMLDQRDAAFEKAYRETAPRVAYIGKLAAARDAAQEERTNRSRNEAISSAQVDQARSKLPSGKLQKALFGNWYYERDGEIVFKSSGVIPVCKYNVDCDSNGKVNYYTSGGKKYQTKKAMIQAHLADWRNFR